MNALVSLKQKLITAALCCVAVIVLVGMFPLTAHALQVTALTARPNLEGSEIMGAAPTRVTYDIQLSEDDWVKNITFEFDAAVHFDVDDVKVTGLKGLTRLNLHEEKQAISEAGVALAFDEPVPPGTLVKIELYDLSFPADGGIFTVQGIYQLVDGSEHALPESPSISVVGVSLAEQISVWLSQQPWVQAWNQNKFLHTFFDPSIAVTSVPVVFQGWFMALALTVASFPLAIPIGLAFSFLRMSGKKILRALGSLYVNVVRGTPLFLQMYIAYFGLPLLGFNPGLFLTGVMVLVMNSGAYLAEIFRAGIQSINKGQFEASRSLGMNGVQTMFSVIIPQTIRRVLPTMTSEFILLYKDTSLLAAVGVLEIMTQSKSIAAATGNMTPYIVAACFYLLVTLPMTKFVQVLENKMAAKDTGGSAKKTRKKNKKLPGTVEAPLRDAAVAAGYPATAAPTGIGQGSPQPGDRGDG